MLMVKGGFVLGFLLVVDVVLVVFALLSEVFDLLAQGVDCLQEKLMTACGLLWFLLFEKLVS